MPGATKQSTNLLAQLAERISNVKFERQHSIGNGQQMYVLDHPALPFIVKVPNGLENCLTVPQAYELGMDTMGGIAAPYALLPPLILNLDGRSFPVTDTIAQQRASDFDPVFITLPLNKQIQAIEQVAQLDRRILNAGVCIMDLYFKNLGFIDDQVRVVDIGTLTKRPNEQESVEHVYSFLNIAKNETEHYLLERGFTLHNRLFELGLEPEGKKLQDAYVQSTGLRFVEDYEFGITPQHVRKYERELCIALQNLFCHITPLQQALEHSDEKAPVLFQACHMFEDVATEFLNIVHRLEYREQFMRTALQEFELHYRQNGAGSPIPEASTWLH